MEAAVECRQCGDPGWIVVLGSRRGRMRYWCRRCGAVVRGAAPPEATGRVVADRGTAADRVEPARTTDTQSATGKGRDTGQAAAGAGQRRPAAPGRDGQEADGWSEAATRALADVMPGAMLRWLRERAARAPALRLLRPAALFQIYRGWDAHLAELGPKRAARLAEGDEPAPVPGLPEFAAVVKALHQHLYDAEAALRELAVDGPTGPDHAAALRERVAHAHRWLGTYAREQCWIVARVPESGPPSPDTELVKQARAALESGTEPERRAAAAARAALFGTAGGPRLSTLQRNFPAARMVEALTVYLETGDRPLRREILARLDAARSDRTAPADKGAA